MLERNIERAVCAFAKKKGWWALKLNVVGIAGFPDRMFIKAPGRIVFMEFKAPGKKPRPAQVRILKHLSALGFNVAVCDNVIEGCLLLE